ncbi:MAG: hypothetical protein JNL11_06750 [Bdellovibrionaceae bacterium]|nr:hypothetical protein [Pseudobdellovibrionaceae bacterium]
MRINFVHNSKGLTAIELLFSVFITAMAILTLNIFFTQMNFENKKLSDNTIAARKNYDFLELMNNPTMWKATVLDVQNYAFYSCKLSLNPHPDAVEPVDCSKVDNKFRIVSGDGSGTVIYDQNEKDDHGQSVGFTPEGVKCFGFDATHGSDSCPTRYEVSWDLPCLKNANCTEPMATVLVKQITKYQTKPVLNAEKKFNLNVNLPQSVEIAPRDSTYLVNINDPQVEINVLKTNYAVDTFNLKVKTVESAIGSTVSIQKNKIRYTPKPNFYGIDKVYYTIEQNLFDKVTKSDGVVWVKVMTPYTWIGEGSIEETNSLTGKKWYSLYDKRNWCGTVVNGECTHFDADPSKKIDLVKDTDMHSASLVFNDTCIKCDVLLKGLYSSTPSGAIRVNAIEIAENFPGEIKQVDDLNIVVLRNSYSRKSDDPELKYAFWQRGGSFIGANSKANLLMDEVYLQNKSISIVRDEYSTSVQLNFQVRPTMMLQGFGHMGIEGGKFYAPENLSVYSGYNLIGSASQFYNQNGRVTVFSRWNGGNTIDANGVSFSQFAFDGSGGYEYGIVGNFNVKDFYLYQTGGENQIRSLIDSGDGNIYVSRNIYLHGSGGFMVNGVPGWGYANFIMNGNLDQYIYSNLDLNGNKDRTKIGRLPILTIDKPAGITHIKGDLGINTGIDIKRGTMKFYDDEERAVGDKQVVEFSAAWNQMFIRNTSAAQLVFPNLEFAPQCSYINIETDIRVTGDFIQDKKKYTTVCGGYPFGPHTHKIYVEGDVYANSGGNDYDSNGLVTIELTGTKNQRIIGNSDDNFKNVLNMDDISTEITTNIPAAKGYLVHVEINKRAGKVIMTGAIGFMGRFRVVKRGGGIDASNAILAFANSNDCCSPGYGILDLDGLPSKTLRIKGLHIQRSLNLNSSTIEITDGLNLPNPNGAHNNGVVSNGTLKLIGNSNVYYAGNFDRVTSDVDRAKLVFSGVGTQTLYSVMSSDGGRVGTFNIEINKKVGSAVGVLHLDCRERSASTFVFESVTIKNGNLNLNSCGMKVTKRLEVERGNFSVGQKSEEKIVENGVINRGVSPGVFQYDSLSNKGTIIPEVLVAR